jgi:hypothetical protein
MGMAETTEDMSRFVQTLTDSGSAVRQYTSTVVQGGERFRSMLLTLDGPSRGSPAAVRAEPGAVSQPLAPRQGVAATSAISARTSTVEAMTGRPVVNQTQTLQQDLGRQQSTLQSQRGETGSTSLAAALNLNTQATILNTQATLKATVGGGSLLSAQQTLGAGPGSGPNMGATVAESQGLMERFGNTLETVFSRGRQTILSLVSAADPSAFSTFQASFEGLSIQVGKVFVPYVETLSHGLQDAARWFESLDGPTKTWIGRIGVAAVGAGGLVVGLRTLSATLGIATGAMLRAGAAFAISPFGIVLGSVAALAAGVVTLTGSWERLGTVAGRAIGVLGGGKQHQRAGCETSPRSKARRHAVARTPASHPTGDPERQDPGRS